MARQDCIPTPVSQRIWRQPTRAGDGSRGCAKGTALCIGGCEVKSVDPAIPDIRALRARFEELDQAHVWRFWDGLSPEGRRALADQAAGLDLPAFLRGFRAAQQPATSEWKIEPPEVESLPESGGDPARRAEARERGESLLREGRAALLVVA